VERLAADVHQGPADDQVALAVAVALAQVREELQLGDGGRAGQQAVALDDDPHAAGHLLVRRPVWPDDLDGHDGVGRLRRLGEADVPGVDPADVDVTVPVPQLPRCPVSLPAVPLPSYPCSYRGDRGQAGGHGGDVRACGQCVHPAIVARSSPRLPEITGKQMDMITAVTFLAGAPVYDDPAAGPGAPDHSPPG